MQRLDTKDWDEFWEKWEKAVAGDHQRRMEMMEKVGAGMTKAVRATITGSGLHDSRGLIAAHQNPHLGEFGGYAAVRADSVEILAGGQRKTPINVGRLTNYLTSGHRVRPPSGRSKRYRPRASMARVPGFDFYKDTKDKVLPIAREAAEDFLRDTVEEVTK